MSAVYQGQEFTISEQDLAQLEQELEGRAEQVYVKCNDAVEPLDSTATESFQISEELYLESLLTKWEDEEYTPEQEDMMWEESYRMESDILETENEWL